MRIAIDGVLTEWDKVDPANAQRARIILERMDQATARHEAEMAGLKEKIGRCMAETVTRLKEA